MIKGLPILIARMMTASHKTIRVGRDPYVSRFFYAIRRYLIDNRYFFTVKLNNGRGISGLTILVTIMLTSYQHTILNGIIPISRRFFKPRRPLNVINNNISLNNGIILIKSSQRTVFVPCFTIFITRMTPSCKHGI